MIGKVVECVCGNVQNDQTLVADWFLMSWIPQFVDSRELDLFKLAV